MATIIKINGNRYEAFQDLNIDINFDSLASTFSFSGLFDTDNSEHRRIFRPLSYNSVEIYDGNTLLLTGVILSHRYSPSNTRNLVPVSGYSLPGVLVDSSIPTSKYPLETLGKSLIEITEDLISEFGISLVVDPSVQEDAAKLYEKSLAKGNQTVGNYISKLASQRNIIVSHTPRGEVLFTRPRKNQQSIATYRENVPTLQFNLTVNGQGMHSAVTVLKQGTVGSSIEGNATANNPLITAFRPLVKEQTNGSSGDTDDAARNAISAELKNISLMIDTDRWIWFDGRTISTLAVNNYVDVIAPQCYIARRASFFVKKVTFIEDNQRRTARLECVLPETFNGDEPRNIFVL